MRENCIVIYLDCKENLENNFRNFLFSYIRILTSFSQLRAFSIECREKDAFEGAFKIYLIPRNAIMKFICGFFNIIKLKYYLL